MGTNNLEVDKTEESAAEVQGSGKSSGFDNLKKIIADKLHGMSEGLGKNAADQGEKSGMTCCGKQASEWLDHSADYIRKFDCQESDAKVREYVGQNPLRSLLIAGGAGLLIGAIFRRR